MLMSRPASELALNHANGPAHVVDRVAPVTPPPSNYLSTSLLPSPIPFTLWLNRLNWLIPCWRVASIFRLISFPLHSILLPPPPPPPTCPLYTCLFRSPSSGVIFSAVPNSFTLPKGLRKSKNIYRIEKNTRRENKNSFASFRFLCEL